MGRPSVMRLRHHLASRFCEQSKVFSASNMLPCCEECLFLRRRFVDLVDDVFDPSSVKCSRVSTISQNRADLFEGFARSEICHPNQEDHSINKPEGVVQHQAFHLSVVS